MIKIVAGGKKHLAWVAEACAEYEKRLRKPFDLEWRLVDEEKLETLVLSLPRDNFVILLDERGDNVSSPELSKKVSAALEIGREVVFVIGGAYGVSEDLRRRADFVWSLSKLVFPHQFCRAIVVEQIYRAQEIYLEHPYHHI